MIAKEIEREGTPVAHITAMSLLAKQVGANRVVSGVKVPHPCGDPHAFPETDHALRRRIVEVALDALQTDVDGPTLFTPANILYTSG